MTIPTSIQPGTTIEWTEYHSDYLPADGWKLKLVVLDGTNDPHNFISTPDGENHKITISAVESGNFSPNTAAHYRTYINSGDDSIVHQVDKGTIKIEVNFLSAGANTDPRSDAEIALHNISEYLKNPNSVASQSYNINNRSMSSIPIP